jgi:hypothetical protein
MLGYALRRREGCGQACQLSRAHGIHPRCVDQTCQQRPFFFLHAISSALPSRKRGGDGRSGALAAVGCATVPMGVATAPRGPSANDGRPPHDTSNLEARRYACFNGALHVCMCVLRGRCCVAGATESAASKPFSRMPCVDPTTCVQPLPKDTCNETRVCTRLQRARECECGARGGVAWGGGGGVVGAKP